MLGRVSLSASGVALTSRAALKGHVFSHAVGARHNKRASVVEGPYFLAFNFAHGDLIRVSLGATSHSNQWPGLAFVVRFSGR